MERILILTAALIFGENCSLPVKSVFTEQNLQKENQISLSVESSDPADLFALCRYFYRSGYRISECSLKEKHEGASLYAGIQILSESGDFFRNAGFSLLSLGSYTGVSSSGRIALKLQFKNRKPFYIEETGRHGYWFILPPPTGLPGTVMGSVLNLYRKPESLRIQCRRALQGANTAKRPYEACLFYSHIVSDALEKNKYELRRYLNGAFFEMPSKRMQGESLP